MPFEVWRTEKSVFECDKVTVNLGFKIQYSHLHVHLTYSTSELFRVVRELSLSSLNECSFKLKTSPSNPQLSTSELKTSTSELEKLDFLLQKTSSELGTSSFLLQFPSSEPQLSASEVKWSGFLRNRCLLTLHLPRFAGEPLPHLTHYGIQTAAISTHLRVVIHLQRCCIRLTPHCQTGIIHQFL